MSPSMAVVTEALSPWSQCPQELKFIFNLLFKVTLFHRMKFWHPSFVCFAVDSFIVFYCEHDYFITCLPNKLINYGTGDKMHKWLQHRHFCHVSEHKAFTMEVVTFATEAQKYKDNFCGNPYYSISRRYAVIYIITPVVQYPTLP